MTFKDENEKSPAKGRGIGGIWGNKSFTQILKLTWSSQTVAAL